MQPGVRPGILTTMAGRNRRTLAVTLAAVSAIAALVPGTARADDEPAPLRSFVLATTGDFLPHLRINAIARRHGNGTTHDYTPFFSRIKPLLAEADLAICHLEPPVAPPGTKITADPMWGAPASIAASMVSLGYDRCSTATNHSGDRGRGGVIATINAFEAAGLGFSGTGRTPEEAQQPPIIEVNGVRVAHLAYTFGFTGERRLHTRTTARVNLIRSAQIILDATDARSRGAEVVIVSMHWGNEYVSRVTPSQRRIAQTVTASGAVDLIVGSHAHVLQPIEQVNGKWVVYGMGNILADQRRTGTATGTQDGVVVQLTFTERDGGGFDVGRPVVFPTWVRSGSFQVFNTLASVNNPALSKPARWQLARSLARVRRVLGAYVPAPAPPPTTVTTTVATTALLSGSATSGSSAD